MSPRITPTHFAQQPGWQLSVGPAQLQISAQGAQILTYQVAEQAPIIWLSDLAEHNPTSSARGGIPICWPWFGAIERNPQAVQQMTHAQAPFHGLARLQRWQLLSQATTADSARLVLQLDTQAAPLADWPHAACLTLEVVLTAEQLSLQLTTDNLGPKQLHLSQALHSYFAVSAIQQVEVTGLENCHYIETLEHWQTHQQTGVLRLDGETDRIYLQPASTLQIVDKLWQRRIQLHSQHSHSAVVWNPGPDRAQQLSQFDPAAWPQMLCIETANIWDDCLSLAPGASHSLDLIIECQSLSATN